ncbi:hypothetical protein OKW38_001175 [Paraburkholderia sp. MM5496-R1]
MPRGASALYANTGIPASSAARMGLSKALGSTIGTAMASAFAAIAEFTARTISPASEVAEPVH